jgi:tRNA nucleotidyltransferase (CCA-adding enzyme)
MNDRLPDPAPLLAQLRPLFAAIGAAGGRPLLVGGAVRDWLLGRAPADVDVEVYGLDADRLAAALALLGRVDAVGRAFGVLKLRLPDQREVDVALPQRRTAAADHRHGVVLAPDPSVTPREAAARRDFTINAMALTPDGALLDYFGGADDLRAGVLRHVSPAFAEDALRPLRAMQLAARFGLRLAPETAALCRDLLPEAATLPVERVWGEWEKWAARGTHPSAGLRALAESGWLALYPELAALVGCPQDATWHPEGDVWVHTGHVCDAAARIAARDGLAGEARVALLLAALCHDLGKPATTAPGADGRLRSPGHDQAGALLARSFLARIGCPRALAERIVPLVREHLAHLGAAPTARVVRRLAARLAPATVALWGRLVEADAAGRPPLPPATPAAPFVAVAEQLGVVTGRPAPILRGQHLLQAGYAPGPALGALLRRAYQAQLDGAFDTVEGALAWVAQHAGG